LGLAAFSGAFSAVFSIGALLLEFLSFGFFSGDLSDDLDFSADFEAVLPAEVAVGISSDPSVAPHNTANATSKGDGSRLAAARTGHQFQHERRIIIRFFHAKGYGPVAGNTLHLSLQHCGDVDHGM
jgi:hypothetical protein